MTKYLVLVCSLLVVSIGCESGTGDGFIDEESMLVETDNTENTAVDPAGAETFIQGAPLADTDATVSCGKRDDADAVRTISNDIQPGHGIDNVVDEKIVLDRDVYTPFGTPSLSCAACAGQMGINTDSPIADLHVVGSDTSTGEIAVAPNTGANYTSSVRLCEDKNCTYEMSFKYDGADNKLKLYGKSGSTVYGPHLEIDRASGDLDIHDNYLKMGGSSTIRGWSSMQALNLDLYVNGALNLKSLGLFIQDPNGNTFANFNNSDKVATIRGTLKAEEIIVEANLADYVFEDGYPLRSLEDIQRFIADNKHLPDMPSAADVDTQGLSLGDFNNLLLQKIEELTLHMIDQNAKIRTQADQIASQSKALSELKAELNPRNGAQ